MSQDQNKVISLANHKGDRNSVNQSKLEHIADAKRGEKRAIKSRLAMVLLLNWMKEWREFF